MKTTPNHRQLLARLFAMLLATQFVHAADELNLAALGPEYHVSGAVLAANVDQIGLLQYGDCLTNDAVVVYGFCLATELPADRPLATGNEVTIDYLSLPNGEKLATRVRRLLVGESLHTGVQPMATMPGIPAVAAIPLAADITSEPELETAAQLNASEQFESAASEIDAEPTDHFSFGKVLQVTSEAVTVREFDFGTDKDVEFTYRFQPDTEFSNLSEAEPLQAGDSVILVYLVEDGQRHLTTLRREDQGAEVGAPASEDRFSFGKVISLVSNILTVKEYDFAKDADVETAYLLQAETEYGNVSEERPLQIGDDVVLDYLERDGQRLVTTLVREVPDTEAAEAKDSVGTVIGINCEQITLLEHDHGEETEVTYQLVPETRFEGFTEDRPVQLGELVLTAYREENSQRYLKELFRDEHPARIKADDYSYAQVVRQSKDGILTVREFDVAADAEVVMDYQLTGDIRQSPGNHVILDYQIVGN